MKICPECARSYSDDAVVCAFDGTPLSTGTTAAWEQDQSAEPEVGDVLGAYRIVSRLGHGGMGVIYEAEHVRIHRKVALKVLKAKLVRRSNVVRRFFEEARAVNEIGHPNIVDIIDFVEVADQEPPLVYMVMELLRGEDLGKRLRRSGPIQADEAVRIAAQVADALAAVHRVKILHRDLKPENIFLVQTDDGRERVKLLDFGVAKAFGQRPADPMTNPGTAVGTPEYMAPEQILEQALDERTDLYALGLVLYEMLCGSLPFRSSNPHDLMIMQVKEQPEPVSVRCPADGPPVPAALEQVVMRCLDKRRVQRYQSAEELGQALLAAVGDAGSEVGDKAPGVKELAWRWRLPLAIAAAALLVWLAVALYVSRGFAPKAPGVAPHSSRGESPGSVLADGALLVAPVSSGGPDDERTTVADGGVLHRSEVASQPSQGVDAGRLAGVGAPLGLGSQRVRARSDGKGRTVKRAGRQRGGRRRRIKAGNRIGKANAPAPEKNGRDLPKKKGQMESTVDPFSL